MPAAPFPLRKTLANNTKQLIGAMMMQKKTWVMAIVLAGALALGGGALVYLGPKGSAQTARAPTDAPRIMDGLQKVLAAHRQLIVLFADENALSTGERDAANQVGQVIFHENRQRVVDLEDIFETVVAPANAARFETVGALLDYVESNADLYDADRLAFRELLRSLQGVVAKDGSLPAIKLHKRIGEDLDALAEIERNYEKEIRQVFGRFENRAIELKRERWEDYVASLKKRYSREQILKDYGMVMPYPLEKPVAAEPGMRGQARKEESSEIFGHALPPKTLALTFDDGPHGTYTAEIAAILKQFSAPAIFFEVGSNLGNVGADGKPKLLPRAAVSRKLLDSGYVIANHSLTHAQLSKRSGDALKTEILNTDELLKAVDPRRSTLFRFPYGARNDEGLKLLEVSHLHIDDVEHRLARLGGSRAGVDRRPCAQDGGQGRARHHSLPRYSRAHRQGVADHPRPVGGRRLPVCRLGRQRLHGCQGCGERASAGNRRDGRRLCRLLGHRCRY